MSFLKCQGSTPKDSDLIRLELTNQDLPTISYVKKKKKTHCHYINDTQVSALIQKLFIFHVSS